MDLQDKWCQLFEPTALPGTVCSQLWQTGPQDNASCLAATWGLLCSLQLHFSAGCSLFLNFSFPPRCWPVTILMEASLAPCPDAYCSLHPELTRLTRVLVSQNPLLLSPLFCFVFCMCSFVKHTRGTVSRSSSVSSVNSP